VELRTWSSWFMVRAACRFGEAEALRARRALRAGCGEERAMKTEQNPTDQTTMAATVAPEDLRRGDYVSILNEVVEFPTCCWLELPARVAEEPVRVRFMSLDAGIPLKVQAICLPFVFVRHPNGRLETLDVRRLQLVRLGRCYARVVWKSVRKARVRQPAED
jgi:hypothetical protein